MKFKKNLRIFADAMKYNTFTLANGLRVIHEPLAAQVVYCGYGIYAGTRDEMGGNEGLAHFCEHTTFKGTAHRSASNILNSLESVGGDLNAFTNKENTFYHAAVMKKDVARAVDLLTDLVFHATYPQNEIEKEVEVICDEIESYNDSPSELIYDEFDNLVFAGTPLGHNVLGTAERVRSFTTADALQFTAAHYRPGNMVFFLSGDVDFGWLVRRLERLTSDLPPSPLHVSTPQESRLPAYEPQEIAVRRNTHQVHFITGCRTFSAFSNRKPALWLLTNILGGTGMNARLNLALRERNGLVYTVESFFGLYQDTGVWTTYFGCDESDLRKCRRLMRHEFDKLMDKPLSATALQTAKRQMYGQLGIAADNRESNILAVARLYLKYGWLKSIEWQREHIEAVTAEDIRQLAQDMLQEQHLTTLIFR